MLVCVTARKREVRLCCTRNKDPINGPGREGVVLDPLDLPFWGVVLDCSCSITRQKSFSKQKSALCCTTEYCIDVLLGVRWKLRVSIKLRQKGLEPYYREIFSNKTIAFQVKFIGKVVGVYLLYYIQ